MKPSAADKEQCPRRYAASTCSQTGKGIQQTAVEVHGNQAMEKPGRLLCQRVLIGAKRWQRMLAKPIQFCLCGLVGHCPSKRRQVSRIVGKTAIYRLDHVASDLVEDRLRSRGNIALSPPARAVIGVVVPFASRGLVAFHQQSVALAHIAIEVLHPQLLSPVCPVRKILLRCQKARIGQTLHRDTQLLRPALHALTQPVFPGLTDNQALASPLRHHALTGSQQ